MVRYFDGQEVRLGDFVDVDGTPGTVFDIIEDEEVLKRLDEDAPMVGFRTESIGEFYQSIGDAGWDETIVLLKRESA